MPFSDFSGLCKRNKAVLIYFFKRAVKWAEWTAFCIIFVLFINVHPVLPRPPKPKILVVHSYHKNQKGHVVEMTEGIEAGLKECRCSIRYFHMDTKRNKNEEFKIAAGRKAMAVVDEYQPDAVIAMDDNAQEYFAKFYAGRKDAPFFIFGGVNAEPEKYGFPAENITGVLERPNIAESISLLQKIVPTVKKIVMLSDKSPTTDIFCSYAKRLDLPVEILAYEQPMTFDQWKAAIHKYNQLADAFGIYAIRTIQRTAEDPSHVPEKELIDYLLENSSLPTVGFFDTAAQTGILCGISVSMREQGFAAAKIACDVLNGRPVSDIPVVPTDNGRIQLNLKTAEKLNINIRYQIIRNAVVVIQ